MGVTGNSAISVNNKTDSSTLSKNQLDSNKLNHEYLDSFVWAEPPSDEIWLHKIGYQNTKCL